MKLDPTTLAVADFYAPSQTALWSSEDEDLSASGVTVLPDSIGPSGTPNMLVGSDKQGHLWLINRQRDEPVHGNVDNTIQYLTMPNIAACSLNCTFGRRPIYNNTVYFGMVNNPVMAFTLTGGLFGRASGMIATPSSTEHAETMASPEPRRCLILPRSATASSGCSMLQQRHRDQWAAADGRSDRSCAPTTPRISARRFTRAQRRRATPPPMR